MIREVNGVAKSGANKRGVLVIPCPPGRDFRLTDSRQSRGRGMPGYLHLVPPGQDPWQDRGNLPRFSVFTPKHSAANSEREFVYWQSIGF